MMRVRGGAKVRTAYASCVAWCHRVRLSSDLPCMCPCVAMASDVFKDRQLLLLAMQRTAAESDSTLSTLMLRRSLEMQVKRVVIIGTSVLFFGTNLTNKTKIGTLSAGRM